VHIVVKADRFVFASGANGNSLVKQNEEPALTLFKDQRIMTGKHLPTD